MTFRRPRGPRAIVTGASRGFRWAIVTSLVEEGAHVVGVTRSVGPDELCDELGDNFTPEIADMTDPLLPDGCFPSMARYSGPVRRSHPSDGSDHKADPFVLMPSGRCWLRFPLTPSGDGSLLIQEPFADREVCASSPARSVGGHPHPRARARWLPRRQRLARIPG